MHLVIVGAGPVGNSLVDLALKAGVDVVVIEPHSKRAEACADRHDVRVLKMDIADDDVPGEADLDQAQAVIATTTDDSANLMAMFLAREHGVKVLTSTVNEPSHQALFEKIGVRVLTDPEILVAQHLLDLTWLPRATDVTTLQDKEQIIEITLDRRSPLIGAPLGELAERKVLPKGLFIVSVERDDEPFFPTQRTMLKADDRLIVFSRTLIDRHDLSVFIGESDKRQTTSDKQ